MKVFYHFSSILLSNTYLIGPDHGGDAVLIDPGEMDVPLLRIIESNDYYVRSILITFPHPTQVHGVNTLLKIYEAKLYGSEQRMYDCTCRRLSGGDETYLAGYRVRALDLTGEAMGPLAYRIENMVFTGMLFTAGNSIASPDRRLRASIARQVETQVLSLPDEVLILPGVGPPSSVRAERALRELTKQ